MAGQEARLQDDAVAVPARQHLETRFDQDPDAHQERRRADHPADDAMVYGGTDRGGRFEDHFERPFNRHSDVRHEEHVNDHYDSRYDDRYEDRYDSRYDSRYDDPYNDRFDGRHATHDWDERDRYAANRGRSELDQDLEAMKKVWSMIRQGAVRMLGEVGRQY